MSRVPTDHKPQPSQRLLASIQGPEDLKNLSLEELDTLAVTIREMILEGVAQSGGHLASNLGTVELTVALHRVFESPVDQIVWDVGHQAYTHKILTGRADRFHTIRQAGGLSGFPKRSESVHDSFGTGHSSTSISAALGLMEAKRRTEQPGEVIAVIGDGAMTAGLAFEGLNHAGHLKKKLLVVLNDNEMSISPNVGALSRYLSQIMTGSLYNRVKKETRNLLEVIPKVGEPVLKMAQRAEDTVKGLFAPGMLFEELGFAYVGPVDGHDIGLLTETFEKVRGFDWPTLVHVVTRKGQGYEPAEKSPTSFHGVGAFGGKGRGTEEYSGGRVDILIATLGKALGVNGGYVVSSRAVIDYLRETSPFYIYSNPITPSEAATAIKSLEILDSPEGLQLLERLRTLTSRLEDGLKKIGLETVPGSHPIVPLMIRDTAKTAKLVRYLFDCGVLATGLNFPVVPRGDEEIRLQVSADHTEKDIDYLLDILQGFT